MYLDQFLSAAPAADPSGVTPFDALGLFAGIPVLIVVLVVGVVYGARRRALRAEGSGPRTRTGALPPLTEPVLGRPDQPTRRLDRERREAEARRAGTASVAEDTAAGPVEQEKGDSADPRAE